jgi:peptide/nickel transport system substrate-binding protein
MKNRINIKKILILLLFIILITGFSGCINTDMNNIENKINKYTIVISFGIDRFNGFYPWLDNINDQTYNINSNIFNCLVEFNSKFGIIPALAENWNNPDEYTWRFYLRKDVKFHNDYNFTAEDVKYSIDLIKQDKNNSFYGFLTMIKEVRIINDFTVEIITFEPYPILLNKIANIYIISKKYQENTTTEIPIGTGAYSFSDYEENSHLTLKRFYSYWKKKPKFQNVNFKFIENYDDRLNALINNQVDMVDFIFPSSIENLSQYEGIKSLTFLHQVVNYLSFDFRENDSCCFNDEENPFSNLKVRKAIYHAINIDEIIENIFYGHAESATQFVTPYISGFNQDIERLPYDLEKASQYMNESGFENGFEVILDTSTVSANRVNVCEIIANQLSKININVTVNVLSSSEFYDKILNRNSSFYLVGWKVDSGDAGEIFDNILRTVDIDNGFGVYNFGNYSNPEIDRIAADIFYNMNQKKRIELMQEGFTIALNDVVCIPLYIYNGISAMKNEISWQPRADGLIKLEDIDFI